ncbi:hypothetical protein PPL_10175 [Heterostelium album PN500]|uniref:Uncharacterized protein n=1 Tax=Heterostelium pallidum (strain ATCC 26659 / Pp 5 / PN500) TaxID=670386 RepID=D3BQJ0_HETP5|nr:hypothetical protein PPL_10175 [Heterostelium album PN500]EFA76410.1 hypothetical protein PPL_10175 [Heterostelium album PN500]|eukprot:XP_020428542.1 hypothetical protein PPL_10175 [Heterostelium album PN500]
MVIPPRPSRWSTRGYKREWKLFMAQMDHCLQIADRITKSYSSAASANGGLNGLMMGGGNARRWTNFFHSRMQSSEELMSPTLLLHVTECLRHYLVGCKKRSSKAQSSNGNNNGINGNNTNGQSSNYTSSASFASNSSFVREREGTEDSLETKTTIDCQAVAEGMLEYVTTHCLDVDNSLIGFTVNPSVAGQLTYRRLNSINQLIKEFSIDSNSSNNNTHNIAGTLCFSSGHHGHNHGHGNNSHSNLSSSQQSQSSSTSSSTSSPGLSKIAKLKGAISYQSPNAKIIHHAAQRRGSSNRLTKSNSTTVNHYKKTPTSTTTNNLTKSSSSSSLKQSKDLNDPLYMIDLLSRWSKMSDRKLANELREFVQAHHGGDDDDCANYETAYLNKGDLVVFKYPSKDCGSQPKYMFGRFTGQICDSPNTEVRESVPATEYLSIYTNPTETEWIWIKRDDIFKFTNQLKMMEQLTNAQKMGSMVECPTLKLQKIIQVKEEELLRNYLSTRSVSPSLLDKLENYTITLKDLRELRSLYVILSQLSSNLPIELVGSVSRMVAAEVGRFLSTVDIGTLYTPTRRTLLDGLERYHEIRGSQLKSRAGTLRSLCENAVGRLISAKLEILDGTRKLRVVNWWLTLIKEQVEDYLKARGFTPDAVPADYTVTPPASLKVVADNLVVLHNALPSGCSIDPQLIDLVRRLKDAIYPVIEDFNSCIRYILCEWLDIDFKEDGEYIDFGAALAKNLATLSSDNIAKIKRMIKDSEYLTEMVRLENSIVDSSYDDARRYESDIIPISGLIFGRLYRIENELRTVIECWHDIETKRSPLKSSNRYNSNNNNNNNNNNNSNHHNRSNSSSSSSSSPIQYHPTKAIIIPTTTIVSPSLASNSSTKQPVLNKSSTTSSTTTTTTTTTTTNNNNNNITATPIKTVSSPQQVKFNIPEIVIESIESPNETIKFEKQHQQQQISV